MVPSKSDRGSSVFKRFVDAIFKSLGRVSDFFQIFNFAVAGDRNRFTHGDGNISHVLHLVAELAKPWTYIRNSNGAWSHVHATAACTQVGRKPDDPDFLVLEHNHALRRFCASSY